MSNEPTAQLTAALAALFGDDGALSGNSELLSGTLQDDVERLKHAMQHMRKSVDSGQMKFFDLTTIKETLGAAWDRKKGHVQTVCETVLKRHLEHRHFYYRASDTIYVIVFDMQDKTAINAASRAISQDIVSRLLGREAVERRFGIETNLASILPDQLPIEINGGSIEGRPDEMRPQSAATAPDIPEQSSGIWRLLERAEQQIASRQEDAPESRKTPDATDRASPHPNPAMSQIRQPSPVVLVDGASEIDFSYSPIWSAAKKAVISHHLNMIVRNADRNTSTIGELIAETDDVELIRSIDRLALKRGIADLTRAIAENRKYIACIPVSSYSLLDKWGMPTIFDSVLTDLAQPLPQLIILDIVDAQALDRRDIAQCAATAAGKCRYLLMRLSLDQLSFSTLANPMIRAIGGSLLDHAWSEKDASRKLDSFVTGASSAKLETFIFGIHSRSMAFAAIAAGFDYISGTAIAPDADVPGGVLPIDMLGLFS